MFIKETYTKIQEKIYVIIYSWHITRVVKERGGRVVRDLVHTEVLNL